MSARSDLIDVIRETTDTSLKALSDRLLRVEFPRDWPVAEALQRLDAELPVRILVRRPYSIEDFEGFDCSTDPGVATAWRNEVPRDYGILVLGGTSGNLDAGLKDIRSVAKSKVVDAWLDKTCGRLSGKGDLGKQEVRRLLRCLFDELANGAVAASTLAEYLDTIESKPSVSTICRSLWHVGLMCDDKVLDTGRAEHRLRQNRDLVEQIQGLDDPVIDQRLSKAAMDPDPAKVELARHAIQFRQDGKRSHLQHMDLEKIEELLRLPTPDPKSTSLDLTNVLNLHATNTEAVKQCLKELFDSWDTGNISDSIEATIEINDEQIAVSIILDPKPRLSNDQQDQDDAGSGLDFTWSGSGNEDFILAAQSSSLKPEGISPDQYFLDAHGNIPDEDAVHTYLEARSELHRYEPWLENDAFALLLLNEEARERVSDYLDAWAAMAIHAAKLDDRRQYQEFVQVVETVQGPSEEDGAPPWITLGTLHPYRLDPFRRTAEEVLKRIRTDHFVDQLGDAANWMLDRSYPSYPQIYRGNSALYLASTKGLVTFESNSSSYMPLAHDGSGLDRILRAIEGFSPWLHGGMSLLVVDPPLGGGVQKALEKARRRHSSISTSSPHIYHQATGVEADPLEKFNGDLRYLSPTPDLSDVSQFPPTNVVLRFVPGPSGSGEKASQNWAATRGCHLALAIDEKSTENPFRSKTVPQIKIDPRLGNTIVLAAQRIYQKLLGGQSPKFAAIRPMLGTDEASVLTQLAETTDWVVFAAPGPLGLISPGTINTNLKFVGRSNMGAYGLYVYATDELFAVRRFFDRHFQKTPVAQIPADVMVGQLVEKAQFSGRAVLFSALGRVDAEVATLVALEIAQEDAEVDDWDFILSLDELAWTRAWLGDGQRADFVLVRIRSNGSVLFRVVESKSKEGGKAIPLDKQNEPYKEALEQVESSLEALSQIANAEDPTLDEDLRFSSLIEQLMASVLARTSDTKQGPAGGVPRKELFNAINALSRRDTRVVFEGYAVLTQSGVREPRREIIVAQDRRLIWAGAPEVERVFDASVGTVSRTADQDSGQTNDAPPAVVSARQSNESSTDEGSDERNGSAQLLRPEGKEEHDPATGPLEDASALLARDFIAAARIHRIPIADDDPVYIQHGPSLLAVGIRLREGATLQPLRLRLADIARDIGIGDRASQVEVDNDAEPRTVRVLLPRSVREFPSLPNLPENPKLEEGYLPVYIGRAMDGSDYLSTVESWPHMLVAGTTGSGKTTFVRTILHQLSGYGPEALQTIVVDGKGDTDYLGLMGEAMFPADWPGVQLGHEKSVDVLRWAVEQMAERQEKIHEIARRSASPQGVKVTDLYKTAIERGEAPEIAPLVIVVDEFADIMLAGKKRSDEFEELVQRVSQVGRSRLIHLVLATQRPDKETIRGAIKANLNARVVFRLPTQADSMTVMGRAGAEKLMLKGDMLFQQGTGLPLRLQGFSL